MTRKNARKIAVNLLYSYGFSYQWDNDALNRFFEEEHYSTLSEEDELFLEYPDPNQLEYIRTVVKLVQEHAEELDTLIAEYSESRKVSRISKTALAVLRCALAEILYMNDIPEAVSINEAVEIAKSYDSPDTISFINGVLGSVSRNRQGKNTEE